MFKSSLHAKDGGPVVLIAHPHDDSRHMYAEFLRAQGYSTLETAAAADALHLVSRADVIVTSIRLHGGDRDGLDLIARLREDKALRNTPVIVVTSTVYEHDRQSAFTAGCDVFLPMPCL